MGAALEFDTADPTTESSLIDHRGVASSESVFINADFTGDTDLKSGAGKLNAMAIDSAICRPKCERYLARIKVFTACCRVDAYGHDALNPAANRARRTLSAILVTNAWL
jgi:hypothetical protein